MGIYCRVSTQGQAEKGFSLEAQKKEGIKKAKQLGFEYKLFVDEGLSAAKDDWDNRPQLHELLTACEKGEVNCVFCTEQDRLSRSPIAMAAIKAIFVKHNIILHTIAALIDFKDTEQEFMADLLTLLSKRENTLKSIRSKRGAAEAAKNGKWIGVVLPYGYRLNENKIMVEDKEEAEVVRRIFRECISGNGNRTIAYGLNEDEIPTRGRSAYKKGTTVKNKYTNTKREVKRESFVFKPGTIYGILTNPIYKGERRYKGTTIQSPIIVEPEMWEMAQDALKKNKNGTDNHCEHFYILKGLLRCGRCGSNLYGRYKEPRPPKKKWGENYYMCSSKREIPCGLRSINITRLDTLVWNELVKSDQHCKHLLDSNQLQKSSEESERSAALARLTKSKLKLEEEIKRAQKLYVSGRIELHDFDDMKKDLSENLLKVSNDIDRINNIEERRAQQRRSLQSHMETIEGIRGYLDQFDEKEKATVIRQLVENIIVHWDETLLLHSIEVYYKIDGKSYLVNEPVLPEPKIVSCPPRRTALRRTLYDVVT